MSDMTWSEWLTKYEHLIREHRPKRKAWDPEHVFIMPVSGCVTNPTKSIRFPMGKSDEWWRLDAVSS